MAKPSHKPQATAPSSAPFGTWNSPITTDMITADVVWLAEVALDGRNIYWIEFPCDRTSSRLPL